MEFGIDLFKQFAYRELLRTGRFALAALHAHGAVVLFGDELGVYLAIALHIVKHGTGVQLAEYAVDMHFAGTVGAVAAPGAAHAYAAFVCLANFG